MSFRNISSWCIMNPVPPIVMFMGLMLAGIVAFLDMDVNRNPDIDFPMAFVSVSQPGAAPSEMETQITQKIEAAVQGVRGVDEITSNVREGSSTTNVQFEIGTNTDDAVNDLRDAVAKIRSELPDGILEPQVSRANAFGEAIFQASIEASDMSVADLSWYVDNDVAKRLMAIPGVAAVTREGGVDRNVRVILDPAALAAQGITAAQVNSQLRQSNLNAAGGRAEIAGSEQSVRVIGTARTAYGLSQTLIALPGGRYVRLADVGRVTDGNSEQRSVAMMNGRQVVSFNVSRAKGASDVTIYDEAWKELKKLQTEDPRVKITEVGNTRDYTQAQYSSAMEALFEGAALAVLVVYLFLRDARATVISALAIPLSAIPAFWFMQQLGITLNNMSLLAMSLVAGVLVDDAIVEIENIVRHMRMGKSAYQASLDAADEIGLAVLATTMSLVAVFLPVALMPGISGQFFRNFGYTVVSAVLMSLLVARMITPLIAAYFLKSHGIKEHASGPAMQKYLAILRWTLRHRWSAVVASLVALAATVAIFIILPKTFQPELNVDYSTVRVSMPPGTTLAQSGAKVEEANRIVKGDPNVESVFERYYPGGGSLSIKLKKKRPSTSSEFERGLSDELASISDARVNFQKMNAGPGGPGRDIVIYLGGNDPELLSVTAKKLLAEMSGIPGIKAPRVLGDLNRPEITVKPRLDLAANLGVTTQALSSTIRIATLGDLSQNSAKFSLSDRQVPITVSLSESDRRDLNTLANLPVPTSSGGSVPLKAVADIGFGSGPTSVQRTNQVRQLVVSADLEKGVVSGDAYAKIYELPTLKNLPEGVQRLNLGDQKWQGELFKSFGIAVAAGILLVFAVLVLLYRRFLSPFVNMGSLLLAPLGAGIALLITGSPLSLPVLIGILMLFGIVAKNSILLIDFAIEMMDHGMPKDEAILEAGHKRAQPIVMTTVAMVAGMIPIALSLSGDGSFRAPMGVTVIGGLIFSTALTLLLVPALFSIALDVEKWVGKKGAKLIDNGEPHVPMAEPVPAE